MLSARLLSVCVPAKACFEQFDALDVDRSGTLEPMELLPVIQLICQTQEPMVNRMKWMFFVWNYNIYIYMCIVFGVGVMGKQFCFPAASGISRNTQCR